MVGGMPTDPDRDFNGMDDRLQWILHGEESISPTAIIGADGRKTVAIVVDFAWHPTGEDIEVLKSILRKHGWAEEEAWFLAYDSTDAISIDKVPVSALIERFGNFPKSWLSRCKM